MKLKSACAVLALSMFSGLLVATTPGSALASGEDFQIFQADCSGFDSESYTYQRGAVCTVNLLQSSCISDVSVAPRGFSAQVMKLRGRRWVPVTRLTHYAACDSMEAPRNRSMTFRATSSGVYSVLLDAIGDRKPAFRASVLAVSLSPDTLSFAINVRP